MSGYTVCKEPGCGRVFTITEAEATWFEGRGLELPKRCQTCRRRRREAKENARAGQ